MHIGRKGGAHQPLGIGNELLKLPANNDAGMNQRAGEAKDQRMALGLLSAV
jgi:hypothetical protein